MRRITVAMMAAAAAMAMPAAGQTAEPLAWFDLDKVTQVAGSAGLKIVSSESGANGGQTFVALEDQKGHKFVASAAACAGDGEARRCAGMLFLATITPGESDGANWLARANAFNNAYAAAKLAVSKDGKLLLSRYLILDHGIKPETIRVNMEVFSDLLDTAIKADGEWAKAG